MFAAAPLLTLSSLRLASRSARLCGHVPASYNQHHKLTPNHQKNTTTHHTPHTQTLTYTDQSTCHHHHHSHLRGPAPPVPVPPKHRRLHDSNNHQDTLPTSTSNVMPAQATSTAAVAATDTSTTAPTPEGLSFGEVSFWEQLYQIKKSTAPPGLPFKPTFDEGVEVLKTTEALLRRTGWEHEDDKSMRKRLLLRTLWFRLNAKVAATDTSTTAPTPAVLSFWEQLYNRYQTPTNARHQPIIQDTMTLGLHAARRTPHATHTAAVAC